MSKFLKQGARVWRLDRARVRPGIGPTQAVVATVYPDGNIRPAGSRGTYKPSDIYETEPLAKLAWLERADSEIKTEQARHNGIVRKLAEAFRNPIGDAP